MLIVKGWVIISAVVCSAGWVLSALHQLNGLGYACVFLLLFGGGIVHAKRIGLTFASVGSALKSDTHKMLRRFTRPLPISYLVLVLMSFLGGIIFEPVHFDSLSYRIPRLLHWLSAGHWHWIHTADVRMNAVACNSEWLWAPILLLFNSVRWFFLVSFVSYLLLPGLVYSFFVEAGVRPRVASWWMWVLPSGYCYSMQAGSLATDGYSVVYALAAVVFAMRARARPGCGEMWLSLLAIALLTGIKQTNLPLLVVWLIPFCFGVRRLAKRPITTGLICVSALLISAAPISYFNSIHTGSWKGFPPEYHQEPDSPFWAVIGNAFTIPVQNVLPPFLPFSDRWNQMMRDFVQTPVGKHFAGFDQFGYLQRSPTEQNAGLGFGVCALALVTLITLITLRKSGSGDTQTERLDTRLVRIAPWLALLVFMAKVSNPQMVRYLAAFYPFLLPVVLVKGGNSLLIRRRWWQIAAFGVMLSTAVLLFLSRQRPLFPAGLLTARLLNVFPNSSALKKIHNAYSFPDGIRTNMVEFVRRLPDSERVIGYAAGFGNDEVALWRPFGVRRVERITPTDSPEDIRRRHIRYVVVEPTGLDLARTSSIQEWNAHYGGELVAQKTFKPAPEMNPQNVYLVRLSDRADKGHPDSDK